MKKEKVMCEETRNRIVVALIVFMLFLVIFTVGIAQGIWSAIYHYETIMCEYEGYTEASIRFHDKVWEYDYTVTCSRTTTEILE